ncbi:MAG: efflux RND transporter periplasmic adaptor subunit [Armatimonadota bacterium]|nr:efflux RND transporter periplasmic adaptor subunit [Armatimonadota bacterium]MDR7444932.1 efflux RND transporter periplasmic adaptor subunit [Armatimonadota bacterium]MDR7570836.1 efflux RND transporter periplasmic adaptor subunit [Armatimonadota bacterium]MDR7615133.1 efflux RND transporter periplasmic adaptor subunit [Armatimonadota bacterium]
MRRWWWIPVLVLAVGGGVYAAMWSRNNTAQTPRWRTAPVVRGELLVTVSASGSVRPYSEVEVKSRATGIVRRVLVREGDRVQAGQVLVEIDDPDALSALRSAQAGYDAAVARLQQLQAQHRAQRAQERELVAGAEAAWRAARARLQQLLAEHAQREAQQQAQIAQARASVEAARARLQQLLGGTRPEEVTQAEQALAAAQADLRLAEQNYTRVEQLVRQGFVARQELDTAAARLASARAQVESASSRLQELRSGPTREQIEEARAAVRQAEAQLQQVLAASQDEAVRRQELLAAQAAVRQAEAQLRQARQSALQEPARAAELLAAQAAVRQAEAQLRNAQDRVRETLIRAPVGGFISALSVQVGQSVIGSTQGGTPVMRIAVVEPVLAKVLVDEVDIPRIQPGMRATVRADALPDQTFPATVLSVSPNAQINNNVVQYEVTLQVTDPGHRLRLGMTVQAEFTLLHRSGVLLIPREAVRGQGVLVVVNGELHPRRVELGQTDGRMVEVRSGLREGETVFLGVERGPEVQAPRNPFLPQFPRRSPTPPGLRRVP